MAELHVCFVCSGNICRSPMAALVFTEHLRRAGLDHLVRVTSAGIGPWHVGDPADSRARRTLAEHGYPTEHVAAQVGERHLDADLLLAMDSGHEHALRDLLEHQGSDADRVRLFRSFDPSAVGDLDIPDPYYGGRRDFTTVLEMIESTMPGLLDWVRRRLDR
ncbi:MAG TPA: low molecular weight protein-tyrosine-phosphatase [Actinophytocola sp.]|uniref:low molecular weight protein-tyrosine-phosphatase n=1 Tax=Actinophytocola sp. TaxID=1872138 RepID=UPI002DDD5FF8|nr:low molecular weight protein-tyrosine-phosphatase [Actinophytocola sp.]HEV2779385.1 low molecular weight protein-tyrosine-phosphatase [Actinophytocola sp.]